MNRWPYVIRPALASEIGDAIQNEQWQAFRMSLKGRPTTEKLDMLKTWRDGHMLSPEVIESRTQVQVDNYLNAMKRGGLINDDLEVVK